MTIRNALDSLAVSAVTLSAWLAAADAAQNAMERFGMAMLSLG